MGESLVRKSLYDDMDIPPQLRLFPDVNVVKIGGQSICDRGIKALPAIIKEIVSVKKKHKILLTTGGGTRSRHIYTIGMELGMPTGIIAKFASTISEQNALLIATLLAQWDGIRIDQDDILKLPTYFSQGCIPVTHGMPPYDYFALPPEQGRLPVHRTDAGTLLMANLIGAKSCIMVKDEDGLYTDNPKTNPKATFIPEIGAKGTHEDGSRRPDYRALMPGDSAEQRGHRQDPDHQWAQEGKHHQGACRQARGDYHL